MDNIYELTYKLYEKRLANIEFEPPLDKGIQKAVELLCSRGIETFASCEGGKGHAYSEPTIRFRGDRFEGFKALAIALGHVLPVRSIGRVWMIIDGEPDGPFWEMVFWKKMKGDITDIYRI